MRLGVDFGTTRIVAARLDRGDYPVVTMEFGHSVRTHGARGRDTVSREYLPTHNIGHFRYLECSRTDEAGRPAGEVMIWDEILFPFDEALARQEDLTGEPVARIDWTPARLIREDYRCDAGGAVTVTISNVSAGYARDYRLSRWAVRQAPVKPGRPKARKPSARGAGKS
jgi:hypothetical protein